MTADSSEPSRRRAPRWLPTLVLTLGYAVAGGVSLRFALPEEPVSLLWLPSGVSLAALTLLGLRQWPGVVLGSVLLSLVVSLFPESSAQLERPDLSALAVFFAAAPLEAVAGAWLLRGPLRFSPPMDRLRDALGLLGASAFAATAGALFGAAGLVLAGNAAAAAFPSVFLRWWLGDAIGMVLVAPFVFTWRSRPPGRRLRARALEFLALAVSFLVYSALYFGGVLGSGESAPKLLFLSFPFLVWAGYSFGPRGSAALSAILAFTAAQGIALERGPFAGPGREENLLYFGLFLLVSAGASAVFAALMAERRRSAAQLAATQSHQNRILSQVPAVVWTTDRDLRFTSSRGAALGPLGLTPDEVVGRTLWEYFGTTDPAYPDIASHLRALEGSSGTYATTWLGRAFTYQVDPLRDDEGEVVGTVGVAVDVTERTSAERALTDTMEQITSLAQSVKAVLWRADAATFRFTFVSNEAVALLGYPVERWTDEPGFWASHIHPEDRERAVSFCRSQVEALSDHVFEYRMIRADGEVIWIRDQVRVRQQNGRATELLGAMIDVTAEKAAQLERRREEERYRTLVEHATLGMYRSDANGRFVWVNPALAAMLGYESPGQLVGADLAGTVYVNPGDRQALLNQYGYSPVSGVEVHWHRKDGSPITLSLSGRGIVNDGRFEGFEMVVEDVTRKQALESQLRQSQKMEALGQLSGGVAHDFNNLLTVILSNTELVASGGLTAEQRQALEEVTAAAGRGAALIRKLLGFSRRERLTAEPLDIGSTVTETSKTLRRLLPENIELDVDVADGLGPARADAGAIWQVLLNLATNARDAMPGGGRLRIRAFRTELTAADRSRRGWGEPGEYIAVEVGDTGQGMDEATRRRAFEPFFTTKPPGQGSGLGLSMVYGLIKQQRGWVDLVSEPGRGTTVTILLPPTDAPVPPVKPRTGGGKRGSETILVVEDEESVRRLATRALERLGYRVLLARDGAEGLELYRRNRDAISLILTDVVMPRMGGQELVDAVRKEGGSTRILFTSGYTSRSDRTSSGIDPEAPFLPKPWTIEELAGTIRQVLDA